MRWDVDDCAAEEEEGELAESELDARLDTDTHHTVAVWWRVSRRLTRGDIQVKD